MENISIEPIGELWGKSTTALHHGELNKYLFFLYSFW